MDNNNDILIPSDDLATFYTLKIATGLTIIYNCHDELIENKRAIVKINKELNEIYKQVRHRLLKHNFSELVKKYKTHDEKLQKLRPLAMTYDRDEDGNRIKGGKITKDYAPFKNIVAEKECIIWECLEVLGLLGKVEKKGVRLR